MLLLETIWFCLYLCFVVVVRLLFDSLFFCYFFVFLSTAMPWQGLGYSSWCCCWHRSVRVSLPSFTEISRKLRIRKMKLREIMQKHVRPYKQRLEVGKSTDDKQAGNRTDRQTVEKQTQLVDFRLHFCRF